MINYTAGMVIFFHDLFTAIWIGGLIMLTLTTLPVLKKELGHCAETEQLMDAIMNRHSKWVFVSILGLAISGLLLSKRSGNFSGLLSFNGLYNTLLSIKHLLMVVMTGLTALRAFGLKSLEKAPDMRKKKMSLLAMHANALVGVVVLLLSGFLAAYI